MPAPETRYARSGDLHIAYQMVGNDPRDLVFVHGWISHIELVWEEPSLARFFTRLASFTRLILLDKRGTGMSDPVSLDRLPTLEERMDDVRAVMDAARSECAALFGTSEAGALNVHPDVDTLSSSKRGLPHNERAESRDAYSPPGGARALQRQTHGLPL